MNKSRDIPKSQRRFVEINLTGARFQNVDLSNAKIRGALLVNAEIDGFIPGMTVNGVEVAPLIRAELERREPDRAKLRATDPKGLREAWSILEKRWARTTTRARRLSPAKLNQRVDDEWSFVETLRHLIFVTDAWISRTILGAQNHYAPMGLATTDMPPWFPKACGLDAKAKPTLAQVLAARRERMAVVRELLDRITAAELAVNCRKNPTGGYPADTRKHTVLQCLQIVLFEEWEHHRFVVRDLDQISGKRKG